EASVVVVWPGTPKERRMQERVGHFGPVEPGDVVSVRSGGGGGWGGPVGREPELVAWGVRGRVVTPEAAGGLLPAALPGAGAGARADDAATRRLRSERGER